LDDATRMNPHLNYAQIQRGPGRTTGSPTGVLYVSLYQPHCAFSNNSIANSDLKGITKITSAILILRKGGNTDWTSALDAAFVSWCREYITWLETSPIALEEASAEK